MIEKTSVFQELWASQKLEPLIDLLFQRKPTSFSSALPTKPTVILSPALNDFKIPAASFMDLDHKRALLSPWIILSP